MKKLRSLLLVLIFTTYLQAQNPKAADARETASAGTNKTQNAESGGKFNLPPEKTV